MNKIYFLFFAILSSISLFGQNSFDYIRSWGTYVGPVNGNFTESYEQNPFVFDASNNIIFSGVIYTANGNTSSYYNQFISTGAQPFHASASANGYVTKLSPDGNFLNRTYKGTSTPMNSENTLAYDSAGNYYVSKITQSGFANANATTGAWLTSNPAIVTTFLQTIITLSKYSPSGVLLWTTFIPNDSTFYQIKIDDVGNIFLAGATAMQTNIGTPGVYTENFVVSYSSNNTLQQNGFIIKLNPQGEKVWGSYLPGGMFNLEIFDNNVYILSGRGLQNINVSTPTTFQQAEANNSILKINGQNGTQVWGTYFGAPNNQSLALTFTLKVNENGVFLASTVYDYLNTGYYTTPGAYKENMTGSSDLLLTKFDLNGNRVWGTFFGGSGDEINISASTMDIFGDEIIFVGYQLGGENISTANAFKTTRSGSSIDILFTKFDTDGNRKWTSYYGGPTLSGGAITDKVSVKIKDADTFFLYGDTTAVTEISTPGSAQPTSAITNSSDQTGFLVRFDAKERLATAENSITKDLVLYDNPNNGNFTLSGSILAKQVCSMTIYDLSGRVIFQKALNKSTTQKFDLQNQLVKGNYLIEVNGSDKQKLKVFKMIVK